MGQRKQHRDLPSKRGRMTHVTVVAIVKRLSKAVLGSTRPQALQFTEWRKFFFCLFVFLRQHQGFMRKQSLEKVRLLYSPKQRSTLWRQMGNSSLGGGTKVFTSRAALHSIGHPWEVHSGVFTSQVFRFLSHFLWCCCFLTMTAEAFPHPSSIKMLADWHQNRGAEMFHPNWCFFVRFFFCPVPCHVVFSVCRGFPIGIPYLQDYCSLWLFLSFCKKNKTKKNISISRWTTGVASLLCKNSNNWSGFLRQTSLVAQDSQSVTDWSRVAALWPSGLWKKNKMSISPAVIMWGMGYSSDKSPVYHSADAPRQTRTVTLTRTDNSESINLSWLSWEFGTQPTRRWDEDKVLEVNNEHLLHILLHIYYSFFSSTQF